MSAFKDRSHEALFIVAGLFKEPLPGSGRVLAPIGGQFPGAVMALLSALAAAAQKAGNEHGCGHYPGHLNTLGLRGF